MKIGEKIKALRTKENMTLQQLSEKSKVALATLSRMENNKMTGTLESHNNIARALGVALTELYSGIVIEEKKAEVQTGAQEADTFVHGQKASYKILTSKILSKQMMPVLLNIQPAGQTNKEESQRGVEKFLYVLEGKLEAVIGEETFKLNKGDSFYFDANCSHYITNIGKETARAICVICPPAL